MKKAINVESKTSLQLPLILHEMDQCCQYGNQPAHSNLAKLQASSIQNVHNNPVTKPSPSFAPKPFNFSPSGSSKTSDKKARREKKRYHCEAQAQQHSDHLATIANTTNTDRGVYNSRDQKDIGKAIYYNIKKKGHYVRKCFKTRKN